MSANVRILKSHYGISMASFCANKHNYGGVCITFPCQFYYDDLFQGLEYRSNDASVYRRHLILSA